MTQWHPIFDHLLRTVLRDYYEVETNVPVGDLPREADIVLVRRASSARPPFRTLWKHLTRWNVLEFKGRYESARVKDVDLLVEVGLGIDRRLQEKEPNSRFRRADVSFWYLANYLGKRFLHDVIELTGELETVSAGLWRGHVVGRPIWLVSNRSVPIDAESASLRMVSEQTVEQTLELARLVAASAATWQIYAPLLVTLYPEVWKEINIMGAKHGRDELNLNLILKNVSKAASPKQLAESEGLRDVIEKIGLDGWLAALTPDERRELAKRIAAGTK